IADLMGYNALNSFRNRPTQAISPIAIGSPWRFRTVAQPRAFGERLRGLRYGDPDPPRRAMLPWVPSGHAYPLLTSRDVVHASSPRGCQRPQALENLLMVVSALRALAAASSARRAAMPPRRSTRRPTTSQAQGGTTNPCGASVMASADTGPDGQAAKCADRH